MFRLYSKGCEYTIRALVHLAGRDGSRSVAVREVCQSAGLPESFTRKMFQCLVRKGVLRAVPGPGGGYRLRQSPDRVSILSIIKAVDGAQALEKCVMGLPRCHDRHPCALHTTWVQAKRNLASGLKAKTLQDLCEGEGQKRPSRSLIGEDNG